MHKLHSVNFIVLGIINIKKYFLGIMLWTIATGATGQRTETALNFHTGKSRLILEVENDMLFQSDSYYTAGLALSYTNKNLKKTLSQLMLKPKSDDALTFSGIGIQQRIFTPYSIEQPNLIPNDRPYTAYLLATNFSTLINTKKRITFSNEIGIGVMGKIAGGKEVQTFVHKVVNSPTPIGWENQLKNSFLIDYQIRAEKMFLTGWVNDHFIPFAAIQVGTLTDGLKIGVTTKFGNKRKFLENPELLTNTKHHFIWEWLFSANLHGVFYDATLQGGLFNNDSVALTPKETISRQYQLRMGVNLYYSKISFRYMVNFNSSNFKSAIIHRYGSVNIGVSF